MYLLRLWNNVVTWNLYAGSWQTNTFKLQTLHGSNYHGSLLNVKMSWDGTAGGRVELKLHVFKKHEDKCDVRYDFDLFCLWGGLFPHITYGGFVNMWLLVLLVMLNLNKHLYQLLRHKVNECNWSHKIKKNVKGALVRRRCATSHKDQSTVAQRTLRLACATYHYSQVM